MSIRSRIKDKRRFYTAMRHNPEGMQALLEGSESRGRDWSVEFFAGAEAWRRDRLKREAAKRDDPVMPVRTPKVARTRTRFSRLPIGVGSLLFGALSRGASRRVL